MTDKDEFSPVTLIEERALEDGLRARATGIYDDLSTDELLRRQCILHESGGTLPAAHEPHPYDTRLKATGDGWQDVICPQCEGQHTLPGPDGDGLDCPLCEGEGVCPINEAQTFLDAVDDAGAEWEQRQP